MRTILLRDARLALLLLAPLGLGCPSDIDGDGVMDSVDDCTLAPDPSQLDADHDGFGNACDADFDQDGLVNFSDLARMKATFSTSDRVTDLNGDGKVDDADLTILKSLFYQAPGPSAYGNDENLYVSTQGNLSGDGSHADPYRRITDAVARARADRAALPPAAAIRIHVVPGTYVGSFSPTSLHRYPEYEVLPIILNVPRVALIGSTVLARDGRGLPTAAQPETETILTADRALAENQHLVLVTRTADGGVGDGVTVEGLALDGGQDTNNVRFPAAGVYFDRVSGFRLRNNSIHHAATGVMTRLASGSIEGNLLSDNTRLGSLVTGGSLAHPATVVERANRATGNLHGLGHSAAGYVRMPTDPGENSVSLLEPLQTTFDRNDPADAQQIPDSLAVTLSGNDASDNLASGIRLALVFRPYDYLTPGNSQPVSSALTVDTRSNTCERNGYYGVLIEASRIPRTDPGAFIQTLTANFEGNTLAENGAAGALVTFVYWSASTGYLGDSVNTYKFASRSTYQLTDPNGELSGFDYDHPSTDPISGAMLDNTFTLNGVVVPNGTSITEP